MPERRFRKDDLVEFQSGTRSMQRVVREDRGLSVNPKYSRVGQGENERI